MDRLKDKAIRVQPYIDFSPLMVKYGIYDQSKLRRFMTKIVLNTPKEEIELNKVMYQCPYNKACKCDMKDPCSGCEDFKPKEIT